MKIGILQCDSVLEEFQPQFGDYPQMLISLFNRVDKNLTFRIYDVRKGQLPLSLDECDAYITTGSRLSVYDEIEWLDKLSNFILQISQSTKKLVAVCFGHQLVADLFGGKTEKSDKGWGVGVSSNQIISKKEWMQPYTPSLNIVVSHQDQVTSLPDQSEIIASSEFCPNFMLLVGENILTIQGHPEFNTQYSQALMRHRKDRIGEERFKLGITSLKNNTDELLFVQWMLNFLRQK